MLKADCAGSAVSVQDAMDEKQYNVTILAGGPSRERMVSLASGRAVAEALKHRGHRVRLADISPEDLSALDGDADVFFIALHGAFGEDGQLQGLLEQRGLVYCGSGPRACRLSSDKHASKLLFAEKGLPTAAYELVRTSDDLPRMKPWSGPVVVKPVTEGSSIGVTIVEQSDQLGPEIRRTLEAFGPVIVEQYLPGKELTVGLLADRALPVIEIRPEGRFYDYHAKYVSDATQYLFETGLAPAAYGRIQKQSVQAAAALGMRDFCRVDWRLDAHGEPCLLEINAIPGFTKHSLLPKAAAKVGVAMPALCEMIVELALARAGRHVGAR